MDTAGPWPVMVLGIMGTFTGGHHFHLPSTANRTRRKRSGHYVVRGAVARA